MGDGAAASRPAPAQWRNAMLVFIGGFGAETVSQPVPETALYAERKSTWDRGNVRWQLIADAIAFGTPARC